MVHCVTGYSLQSISASVTGTFQRFDGGQTTRETKTGKKLSVFMFIVSPLGTVPACRTQQSSPWQQGPSGHVSGRVSLGHVAGDVASSISLNLAGPELLVLWNCTDTVPAELTGWPLHRGGKFMDTQYSEKRKQRSLIEKAPGVTCQGGRTGRRRLRGQGRRGARLGPGCCPPA